MSWLNRGRTGKTGEEGKPGPKGIGIVGRQGPEGERGPHGDHGQEGEEGRRGLQGVPGLPGKTAVTRWQVIVVALFVMVSFILLAWRTQVAFDQDDQILRRVEANTEALRKANIDRCYNGVEYIKQQNEQYQALADIEGELATAPDVSPLGKRIATKRIKVYQGLMTELPPEPICPPR